MFSDNRGTLSDNSRSDLVEKPADGSQLSLEHTFAAPPASADPPSGPEDGGKWPLLTVAGACVHCRCVVVRRATVTDPDGVL
ncbi:hypothetical protein ACG7TL_001713 [Trametes sanguinea]